MAGNELWLEKDYLPGMSAIAIGVLTAMLAHVWKPSENFGSSLAVLGGVGLMGVIFFGDAPLAHHSRPCNADSV